MYVLFPDTLILVLASLPVHSLTMVVCVLVVVCGFVLYVCESSIFVGGSMMVIVLRQYFQLSITVRVSKRWLEDTMCMCGMLFYRPQ